MVGGWIGVEDSERRTDVRGRREGEWPRASPMLGNLTAAPMGSREPVPRFALVCCLPTGAAQVWGGWMDGLRLPTAVGGLVVDLDGETPAKGGKPSAADCRQASLSEIHRVRFWATPLPASRPSLRLRPCGRVQWLC